MLGYKLAYTLGYENVVIVKLDIPDSAMVTHVHQYGLTKDFYFCQCAKVLSITSLDGRHKVRQARSMKDHKFIYTVGSEVRARYCCEIGEQAGIYFFKTRKQAKEYEY